MLFTLTTLKILEKSFVQQTIKHCSKNAFCATTKFRQLLMVADGVLKLGYPSVIFVNPGVYVDEA